MLEKIRSASACTFWLRVRKKCLIAPALMPQRCEHGSRLLLPAPPLPPHGNERGSPPPAVTPLLPHGWKLGSPAPPSASLLLPMGEKHFHKGVVQITKIKNLISELSFCPQACIVVVMVLVSCVGAAGATPPSSDAGTRSTMCMHPYSAAPPFSSPCSLEVRRFSDYKKGTAHIHSIRTGAI